MDCKTARLLIDFARPLASELEICEAERLQDHLADCPECGSLFRAERKVDDHLGQAMRTVSIPEGLSGRLMARVNRERARWYRRRVWLPTTAAAAALILIAVFLGLGSNKPLAGINLENLYQYYTHRNLSPEAVEDWFHKTYQIKIVAPPQFNYALLIHFDLANLEGRRVPFLLYSRDGQVARVFILSDKEFNLKAVEESIPTGYPAVQVFSSPDPKMIYVVIYTGEGLNRFLTKFQDSST
ncbi:MAG TPA: hypothetical protein VGY77_06630 [Gemmataceae bacterium]|nr:hypothetical protein [Gemmataceae bacterium]